ncbi:hypothetical protein Patl1_25819 [Pistacia atlantica]|uniref:Uncharacterized protein n=1 Tax=Pistacia atlantica TaxID=434234 RepID=A0ACC1AYZ5_9ROSI|nr:hypothetical protein Patl1_25819 [Pistacia atlantica]
MQTSTCQRMKFYVGSLIFLLFFELRFSEQCCFLWILTEIQRQNEKRCEQEIEDVKREIRTGNITPNTSLLRFSDDALEEQKHSVRIADEKVTLAVQAYDLVDAHIQQLDQYLKSFDEELRRERDTVATTVSPAPSLDGSNKSGRSGEGGRGGRKKYLPFLDILFIMSLKYLPNIEFS